MKFAKLSANMAKCDVAYCHIVRIMSIVKAKSSSPQSRLNVRLSPEVKSRISRAATILGQDLTEFTSQTLNDRAVEVLMTHEILVLSEREHKFFLDYLSSEAAEPSEKVRKLASEYKRGVRKGETYEFAD